MLTKKNVISTIYISLVVQIVTSLYSYNSIYYDIEDKDEILKDVLKLELFVQFIEAFFYIWVIHGLRDFNEMTKRRYIDWFVTTPTMLISTIIFLKYQEYKEADIQEKITFYDFIITNIEPIQKIVLYNGLMLLFGYLGETNIINKELSIGIGFIFFYLSFKIIYYEYALKSKLGIKLFSVLVILWSLYGIAAYTSHIPKNISYNVLDVIAKNFYGLYIFFKIRELAIIKHGKDSIIDQGIETDVSL